MFSGDTDKSLNILTFLRGSEALAKKESEEYNAATKDNQIKFTDVLSDKMFLKTIGKIVFLAAESQLIGLTAITFYLQTIFKSTNTNIAPEICSAVIGCTQVLGCIFTILMTDRIGRKPILTFSLLGCCFGMVSF